MKIKIICATTALISASPLCAAVFNTNPIFSGAILTNGTEGTIGAEYSFASIGTDAISGNSIDATATITHLNDVTQIRRTPTADISSDGSTITPDDHGLLFAITGTPTATSNPYIRIDLAFFDASAPVVVSNFGFSFSDIDSSIDAGRDYSEFAGSLSSMTIGSSLSTGTQLEIETDTLSDFTVAQLIDFTEGNFSSDPVKNTAIGSSLPEDYTTTFQLSPSDSYNLVFGLIGETNVTEGNRGGTFASITTIESVPEPSSSLLIGLALLGFIGKRRRRV